MSKLRLLFDASALGYGSLGPQHRTGLFQVAVAYLEELRRHPEVELALYTSSGNRLLVARFLKAAGCDHQPWVGSRAAAFLCFAVAALERAVYRSPVRALTPLVSRLRAFCDAGRRRVDRREVAQWQAYLSPMEAVPPVVRDAGLASAVVVHDLIPLILPEYHQDPADPTRWFSRLWRTVTSTDLVLTVSQATRDDWLRLKPEFPAHQVVVAPNAFDPMRFHPRVDRIPGQSFFLAVSTIEPRKRLDGILAGYQAYRAAGGTTKLLIGGKDKAGVLKATDGVELLGFVDEDDLPGLYASCKAFLSFSEYEGFGLPILEAMACGAPVIVSNRTSHPEVAGDAAVYIDPDDTPGIARALALMDQPDQRDTWAARSVTRARQFDWKTTVAAVVARLQKEHT